MAVHSSIKDQKPREQIFDDLKVCGWPGAVESGLRRKVGALRRHHAKHIKIGITNQPAHRWRVGYRKHGWRRMRILYQSSSHEHVCSIEAMLIEQLHVSTSGGYFWNERGGGGGRKPLARPFYVYAVTAPKHARLTH